MSFLPLTLNTERISELYQFLSQPLNTSARGVLHLLHAFADTNLSFYNTIHTLRVNAGLKIINELSPLTQNTERISELYQLLSQPPKTHERIVVGLCHAFVTDFSELYHLLSQPPKTRAHSVLALYHTFGKSLELPTHYPPS
ncbi:hypothetical protein C8F04DRAFT_1272881 [Mycena alexandri]|uniref:Uncharacterized protein n=1 Tax=Mycena alexandri TaxID=1745969 RepID=A0AAD6S9B6_9AGAR|nr:hypothetical protein C8F04DRAFT_1272881 [Mycena alexandri]